MAPKSTQTSIADLVDFYRSWPVLRLQAQTLADRDDLTAQEREVLDWMIRVVDRVGPSDLDHEA